MTASTFLVEKRSQTGTGEARACRNTGKVPGVVYGETRDPQGIAVDAKALQQEMQKPGFTTRVFALNIDGKTERALIKSVQRHPVTDIPMHVDFFRITKDTRITIPVPIHFINDDKAPAIKRGGVLNIVHHRLEVTGPADAMPESFTIDLAAIDLSRGVHLSDLEMPKGVAAAHPARDQTLATVVIPRGESTGDSEEAESE